MSEVEVEDEELWDRDVVLRFFGGIHTTTLYRGMPLGTYPKPFNVAPNVVRWLPSECRQARQRMIAAREDKPPSKRGRPPKIKSDPSRDLVTAMTKAIGKPKPPPKPPRGEPVAKPGRIRPIRATTIRSLRRATIDQASKASELAQTIVECVMISKA